MLEIAAKKSVANAIARGLTPESAVRNLRSILGDRDARYLDTAALQLQVQGQVQEGDDDESEGDANVW